MASLRESPRIDSLSWPDSRAHESICARSFEMLNGKRYFSEFPDEDPASRRKELRSPELMALLKALEKELRPYLESAPASGRALASGGDGK
jgi:hypothetical protein